MKLEEGKDRDELRKKRSWRLTLLFIVCFSLALVKSFISSRNNTIAISSQRIDLNESQRIEILKLGLTPKKPVQLKTSLGTDMTIKGRFLHITDFHPDPYYKEGSDVEEKCHRGKGRASEYGDAIKGCDSPVALVNGTIKWIKENLKDKIDFVIWTGDNVRHDNDRHIPRTEQSIFDMNEIISRQLFDAFRNESSNNPNELLATLIPCVGNNDVYPHNLCAPGPTLQTREMFGIWKEYVPPSQLHVFNKGMYYFTEVIPSQLAVLSINTMYLYQSNPLVDNCDKVSEPGYELFEWLGYVLKEMRNRKMKVWLSGHVPPNTKNYDHTCLRKYSVWSHEYRDVIIGGLYGHMNLDHFIVLDSVLAYKSINKDYELDTEANAYFDGDTEPLMRESSSPFHTFAGVPRNGVSYMESVRESDYSRVKGKSKRGPHSERYSIAHVGPSIIPTYNPGFQIWEYDIEDLESKINQQSSFLPWDDFFANLEMVMLEKVDQNELDAMKKKKKKKKKKEKDKTFPPIMPDDLPLGPAYIHQTFTPERYVLYYADSKKISKGQKEFGYEIEYTTDDYEMTDLTTDQWMLLARDLGKPLRKKRKGKSEGSKESQESKLWKKYLHHAFVATNYENLGYG